MFSEKVREEILTTPIIAKLTKKYDHYETLIHYIHPLFEYLASKDKENHIYNHFKAPSNYKFVIEFELIDINLNKLSNI